MAPTGSGLTCGDAASSPDTNPLTMNAFRAAFAAGPEVYLRLLPTIDPSVVTCTKLGSGLSINVPFFDLNATQVWACGIKFGGRDAAQSAA